MRKNIVIVNLKNLFYFKTPYIVTTFFIYFFARISIYEQFHLYQDTILELLSSTTFTFIGLIGFLLTALTFLLGLIDKDVFIEIENLNTYDEVIKIKEKFELTDEEIKYPIKSIVNDFVFISIIIAFLIITSILIIFLIRSELPIAPRIQFYMLVLLVTFIFSFIICSLIRLLNQCYSIFHLMTNLKILIEDRNSIKLFLEDIEKGCIDKLKTTEKDIGSEDYIISIIHYINCSDLPNQHLYLDEIKRKYNIKDTKMEEIINLSSKNI